MRNKLSITRYLIAGYVSRLKSTSMHTSEAGQQTRLTSAQGIAPTGIMHHGSWQVCFLRRYAVHHRRLRGEFACRTRTSACISSRALQFDMYVRPELCSSS